MTTESTPPNKTSQDAGNTTTSTEATSTATASSCGKASEALEQPASGTDSESETNATGQTTTQDTLPARFAASTRCSRVLGIPILTPSIPATELFSVSGYLFGAFAYLFYGMWRKCISLVLLWIVCHMVTLLPSDSAALQQIMTEAYWGYSLGLSALGLAAVVLYCSGHPLWSLGVGSLFIVLFLVGECCAPYFSLGEFSGFVWLNAPLVWEMGMRVVFFDALARRWLPCLVGLMCGLGLWYSGLPMDLINTLLPSIVFATWCGMMLNYDRYRARVLKETFWW